MTTSLQVLYPQTEGTTFDHDYYVNTHLPLVAKHMGPHIQATQACKGLAGGPEQPAGYYIIVTMTFADPAALDAAMAQAGPVLEDIPNYYNAEPVMLIGEVVG